MKSFLFRLETLLKVRALRESKMQKELALLQQKTHALMEQKTMVQKQISALEEEIRKKRQKGEVALQETYLQILDHLKGSFAQLESNYTFQNQQLELQKERMKQAVQERKLIEKIKEKQYAQWRIEIDGMQGALLDDSPRKTI